MGRQGSKGQGAEEKKITKFFYIPLLSMSYSLTHLISLSDPQLAKQNPAISRAN